MTNVARTLIGLSARDDGPRSQLAGGAVSMAMVSAQHARRVVWRPLRELPRRYDLILSLTRRELAARYRGSFLGFAWSVATPAMMIAIYTFIFAGIFGARFGSSGSKWSYALYLFCGLLPWTAFQESAQSSANTIVAHANLVKKVIFPLETLPVAHALAAIGNQLCGTVALLLATLLIQHGRPTTWLFLPLLLLPQLAFMLGVAWFVAALGVYVRDTAQALGLILTAWMYLTPIIYPASVVPPQYGRLIALNPFSGLIESYRRALLEGRAPDWTGLGYFTAFAALVFFFGYWWFARTRRGFADVV